MKGKEFDSFSDACKYLREHEMESLIVKVGDEQARVWGNGKYHLIENGIEQKPEPKEEIKGKGKTRGNKSSSKDDKKTKVEKPKKESDMTKNELNVLAENVASRKKATVLNVDSKNQRAILSVDGQEIRFTAKSLEKEIAKSKRGRKKGSGKKEAHILKVMANLKEFTVKDVVANVEGVTDVYAYMIIRDKASFIRKNGKAKVYSFS